MNFYPHHISDFDSATKHLTRVERSVYRESLDMYYDTEEPLSSDFERLSKRLRCRSDEEIAALESVLSEFFTLTDAGYVNLRCDIEIEKYRGITSAKSRAGKASAEARRAKKKKLISTGVKQVLNGCSAEHEQNPTNQEPLTKNQEPKEKEPRAPKNIDPEFWAEFSDGIDPKHWLAWKAHRDKNKKPITQPVLERLQREAGKAGISTALALQITSEAPWISFSASWDWQKHDPRPKDQQAPMNYGNQEQF